MAMKTSSAKFKDRVDEGIHNDFMRLAVSSAQERLHGRRLTAVDELGSWEDWRSLGEEIRQHVLSNLDFYLHQLAENVSKRGGHVFLLKQLKKQADTLRTLS